MYDFVRMPLQFTQSTYFYMIDYYSNFLFNPLVPQTPFLDQIR